MAKTRVRRTLRRNPLDSAQDSTLAAFHDTVLSKLKPILGPAGLRRLDKDLAIATTVGGGVVVHAPLRFSGPATLDLVKREGPFVGVLVNTIALYDPVTLKALEPGAYVVGARPMGNSEFAFDFFGTRGAPSFSTMARQTGDGRFFFGIFDVDVELGGMCRSLLARGRAWLPGERPFRTSTHGRH